MNSATEIPKPFIGTVRPVLVTGGAGFIGCNLTDRLAAAGYNVLVYDSLTRAGAEQNLAWLERRHSKKISAVIADIRDVDALAEAASQAEVVFHCGAQVATTTSLDDPLTDFDVNARGTLLLLDRLRRCPTPPPLIFASTSKVYGNLAGIDLVCGNGAYFPRNSKLRRHGISEACPLEFYTPHGCSKGAAEQYVLDWGRSFGISAVVLRTSCTYGPRQLGTEDQGWVAHFIRRALAGKPITLYGDGKQVRDILHVGDAVSAYLAAWRRIDVVRGRAFNLGGGPANAVSLLQIIGEIERLTGQHIQLKRGNWRSGDQRYFVADTRCISAALNLAPPRSWRHGLAELVDWLRDNDELSILLAADVSGAELPPELAL